MKPLRILVMHGPNLNLLGTREPDYYGLQNLAAINENLITSGDKLGCEIVTFQSNHEGELVERIHQAAAEHTDGIAINPAAYTHTSVALRDALLGCHIPFVELHLSNIHRREEFRRHSMLADIAIGIVAGFGPASYQLALQGLVEHLRANSADS
ncbi:MAG: type II 3-dehydroquinate dehydratase [Mariprofundaceae bacterium]|nr:type II 3-dehydroquinate dehydratase [Mariprofundaceae bacterium]